MKNKKRNTWLYNIAFGILFTSSIQADKRSQETIYTREELLKRINNDEITKNFASLSEEVQESVIERIEDYASKNTEVGKLSRDLILEVKVDEVLDNRLVEGNYNYDEYKRIVTYNAPSLIDRFNSYIKGGSMNFARAHERLHVLQRSNYKWKDFEDFFKEFILNTTDKSMNFIFPEDKAREFSSRFLGKPKLSYDQTVEEFKIYWNVYTEKKAQRQVIKEVQAHLAFSPYTNAQSFYKDMHEGQGYSSLLDSLAINELKIIFDSTIGLYGMLEPKEAAIFVSNNLNSADEYLNGVKELEKERKIDNAYQKGLERQKKLLMELQQIAVESSRILDKIKQ